jgi:hypothetical protein
MRQLVLLLVVTCLAASAHARDVDATAPRAVLNTIHALAKDAYVAFHTRPHEGLVAIEAAARTEPQVRVFDDRFAVVNRRVPVRRADATGKVEAFEVQRIEVLRRTDVRWRIVSGQGTRVQH